jgi:hypothetical protein
MRQLPLPVMARWPLPHAPLHDADHKRRQPPLANRFEKPAVEKSIGITIPPERYDG